MKPQNGETIHKYIDSLIDDLNNFGFNFNLYTESYEQLHYKDHISYTLDIGSREINFDDAFNLYWFLSGFLKSTIITRTIVVEDVKKALKAVGDIGDFRNE